jgi:release factor glutamine methyltransferase
MSESTRETRKNWRVIDILQWGEDYFSARHFEHPRREIEWLLGELLEYRRIDLYLQFEEPISKEHLSRLRTWVQRRIKKEPLQYITGKFYGRPFKVTPAVLIPRPETERMVDVALHLISNADAPKVLDVGTGSGCVAVSIAAECPQADVTAVDVSKAALEIARYNMEQNGIANVNLLQLDFLTALPEGRFDLVVSNPPYIPTEEMETLMPDVREYEPKVALTDRGDGLAFYRRMAQVADQVLVHGGWLVMEVGLGEHPRRARDIFLDAGFKETELVPDFNGDERVLKVHFTG